MAPPTSLAERKRECLLTYTCTNNKGMAMQFYPSLEQLKQGILYLELRQKAKYIKKWTTAEFGSAGKPYMY